MHRHLKLYIYSLADPHVIPILQVLPDAQVFKSSTYIADLDVLPISQVLPEVPVVLTVKILPDADRPNVTDTSSGPGCIS